MKNKKFFIGMAVLLSVSLFFIGCPSDVDPEIIDNSKTIGAAADIDGLKVLLAGTANPITYDGVLAIGTAELIVPPGKTLNVAKGVTLGATGKFIVMGTLELGAGKEIAVTGAGQVIGDAAVLEKVTGGSAVKGPIVADVAAATTAFVTYDVALVQNANSADLDSTSVPTGNTLYVFNTLSLGAVPTLGGGVIALGTVSASANVDLSTIIGAGNGKLTIAAATLTNSAAATVTLPAAAVVKAIRVGNTDLTIAGAATSLTVETLSGGAGKLTVPGITVSGETNLQGAAEFGGNATFTGAASFGGTLATSATATLTFNGATRVAGAFTPGDAATIAGTGAVTFTAALGDTSTNKVTIKNTKGVTLTAANTIAANIVATNVTIKGDGTTGVVIESDALSIAVPTTDYIAATATGARIVAGGTTGVVTIAGATLKVGTYTADDAAEATLTLAAATEIEVASGGSVTIGTAGQIVFTDDSSKISLLAGGSLASSAVGDLIKTSSDATEVTLTVGTTADAGTPTHATVGAASPFVVTTASGAGAGSQDVVVGAVSWTIDLTGEVDAEAGAAAEGDAAAGTLRAGTGTTLTIAGKAA